MTILYPRRENHNEDILVLGDWISGKGTQHLWQQADVADLLTSGAAGFQRGSNTALSATEEQITGHDA